MTAKYIYTSLIFFAAIGISTIAPNLQAKGTTTTNAKTAAQLYSKHCVSCHGRDGRSQTSKGKFSHSRDLTDAKWQDDVSDERLYNSIMNGRNVRGNMPGFSDKLKQKEAESLVDLVRGMRQ